MVYWKNIKLVYGQKTSYIKEQSKDDTNEKIYY